MKKIKILYICQPYYIGGGELDLFDLLKNIDRRRFEPLLIFEDKGPVKSFFSAAGFCTKIVPLSEKGGGRGTLIKIIRRLKIDIVHTYTMRNFQGAQAARICGIPHIWHMVSILKATHPHLAEREIDNLLKTIYLFSTRIIASTGKIKEQFQKIYSDKVIVIKEWVDIHSLDSAASRKRKTGFKNEFGLSPETHLVLMVGRLDPQKRHSDFLRAAAIVKREVGRIKFAVIGRLGRDRYTVGIKDLVKELRITDSVIFTGFRKDVFSVMKESDLVVLPSVGEGSGKSILEAMVARKAVVATRSGGISEIVSDSRSGLLVPPKSPQRLALAIISLINNPQKAQRMGLEGRRIVEERHDIRTAVKRLEDLYRQVLGFKR